MINFEEELKKFTPDLEAKDLEESIQNEVLKDVIDVLLSQNEENK